jgi:uncharacterized protein (DUF983 family)
MTWGLSMSEAVGDEGSTISLTLPTKHETDNRQKDFSICILQFLSLACGMWLAQNISESLWIQY